MDNQPFVSVIIPCRNEEKFIGKCLDSIIEQDFPKGNLEILVVDGMSNDDTRRIVKKYAINNSFIRLLNNPKKITPCALNLGIKNAKGEIIIRMDAHTTYQKDYISKCIKYLEEYKVDNVGGIWRTLPGEDTLTAKSIAIALSHPFGVGNSYFRVGLKDARYVDTVPFGCYKKKIFDKIGYFNENLIRNQDIEFNARLRNVGGKILIVPDIISYYHARPTFKELARNNFWNGFWVIYSMKFTDYPSFSIRHLVPAIFVSSVLLSLFASLWLGPVFYLFLFSIGSYVFLNLFFSFKLSLQKGLKHMIPLSLAFSTLHFFYGFGSIMSMFKLFVTMFYKKNPRCLRW